LVVQVDLVVPPAAGDYVLYGCPDGGIESLLLAGCQCLDRAPGVETGLEEDVLGDGVAQAGMSWS